MTPEQKAALDAIGQLPDAFITMYLQTLRGLNRVVGTMLLEDPGPADALERAIDAAAPDFADTKESR